MSSGTNVRELVELDEVIFLFLKHKSFSSEKSYQHIAIQKINQFNSILFDLRLQNHRIKIK